VIEVKRALPGSVPALQPKRFLPNGLVFVSARHGWLSFFKSADSFDRRGVLETRDGGRSWTQRRSFPRFQPPPPHDTSKVCPNRPPHFAIASSFWTASDGYAVCGGEGGTGNQEKRLYETSDGGKTWRERASEKRLPSYGYVEALRFFNSREGAMLTVRGGIYTTTDDGLTWRCSFYNPGEGAIYWSWPDSEDGYLAAWDNGVYVSHDLGRHWQRIWPRTIPVSYASASVAIAVIAPGPRGLAGSTVLRTMHGGRGWSFFGYIRSADRVFQLVRISAQSVVAVASRSWTGYGRLDLFRSNNGGRSWRPLPAPPTGATDASTVSLSFRGAVGLLLDNVHQRLFVTRDGGSSWQLVGKHPDRSSFVVLDAEHCLAASPYQIDVFTSSDAGKSWQRLRPGVAGSGEVPVAIAATDARHIWIVAGGADVFRSSNGGESWVVYRMMYGFDVSWIGFVSPKVGFASIDDPAASPVRPQLITRDGGRTWTALPTAIVVRG
jgi:photosystem II stability/assembly factor-like uncharacterized protein